MPRIFGTETEFGISSRAEGEADPVADSLLVVSRYPALPAPHGIWDYENENPLLDARGFEVEGERERPGPAYNRQLNQLLSNGGRWYVDGAHPEYSTPECTDPRELVAYERAGHHIAAASVAALNQAFGGEKFCLYKNNSDGKGNSYGYHENYLMARAISFDAIIRGLIPFFVTRQIFTGAGKVGAENGTDAVDFQLSQRADFFECLVDLNTMVKRPIINTRDEPHADPSQYRRLHVIVGDANMSEWSTYLKVGTTAIVVQMIESGVELPVVELEDPIQAMRFVSRDVRVKRDIRLAGGQVISAIDLQRRYLESAHHFFSCHELTPATKDVLIQWEAVLDRLERDPMELADTLDWVAKRAMMVSYMDRKGCGWSDPRVKLMDLQYHDVRPEKGLYFALERRGHIARLLDQEAVEWAEHHPPAETRAFFRGMCLRKFPKQIYGVSWTSVLFDTGDTTIKRISLMDPARGTKALTQDLFDGVDTVEQLLERLQLSGSSDR